MTKQEERMVRCRITGTVQGVGYRYWTQRMAQELKLRGWVMNQADGSVCALFIGGRQAIKDMMSACQQGPSQAVVTAVVEVPPQEQDAKFMSSRFELRY